MHNGRNFKWNNKSIARLMRSHFPGRAALVGEANTVAEITQLSGELWALS